MSTVSKPQYNKVFKGGNFLKPKKWEDWVEGDFVAGEFVGCSEMDLYGKPIYEIKVSSKKITGQDPEITTGEKAGIIPLYSNGALNTQMEAASFGDNVCIEYKGMAKGKPCHSIEVGIEGYVDPNSEEGVAKGEETADDLLG